jgi:hypothetical protein
MSLFDTLLQEWEDCPMEIAEMIIDDFVMPFSTIYIKYVDKSIRNNSSIKGREQLYDINNEWSLEQVSWNEKKISRISNVVHWCNVLRKTKKCYPVMKTLLIAGKKMYFGLFHDFKDECGDDIYPISETFQYFILMPCGNAARLYISNNLYTESYPGEHTEHLISVNKEVLTITAIFSNHTST